MPTECKPPEHYFGTVVLGESSVSQCECGEFKQVSDGESTTFSPMYPAPIPFIDIVLEKNQSEI